MKQKISEVWTEETPTLCEECRKFYSGGSCMIFKKGKPSKNHLCKECFNKIEENQ